MTTITLIQGDITQQETEAIVNSANPSLLGGGGVDGAIHAAAGPNMLDETRKLGPIDTGQAVITNGHFLPNDYVIHVVGPIYGKEQGREATLLVQAYRSVLEVASQHLIRTLSFPSISTGAYGYPIEEAALNALATVRTWVSEHPDAFDEIRFVLHSQKDLEVYQALEHQS